MNSNKLIEYGEECVLFKLFGIAHTLKTSRVFYKIIGHLYHFKI